MGVHLPRYRAVSARLVTTIRSARNLPTCKQEHKRVSNVGQSACRNACYHRLLVFSVALPSESLLFVHHQTCLLAYLSIHNSGLEDGLYDSLE